MALNEGTGLIFDRQMLEHRCVWDYHPERPDRLQAILTKCQQSGVADRCIPLKPRAADPETEIALCHSKNYIDTISKCSQMSTEDLEKLSASFEFAYLCHESYNSALMAAGCAIEAMESVIDSKCRNAMALVRPPGHHASVDKACGFCIFNNVAICAKLAVEKYEFERVLIVDWDVHAAQGTQYCIEGDERILLLSLHRYQHGNYWPNLPESNWDQLGNTINLPLNEEQGLGDADYLSAFHQFILPVANEFQPQLILISSGYDAAFGDAIDGHMYNLTPAVYAQMTRKLMTIAHGKVVAVLEGGYFLDSLTRGVVWTLKTLLGDPVPDLALPKTPSLCLQDVLTNAAAARSHQFKCLQAICDSFNLARQLEDKEPFEPSPVALYYGSRRESENYGTRGLFPPRKREEDWDYSDRLKRIVSEYKIRNPKQRLAVIAEKTFWKNAPKAVGEIAVEEKITNETMQYAVDILMDDLVRDILLLSPEDHSKIVAKHAREKHGIKRILVLKICMEDEELEEVDDGSENIIYEICICINEATTRHVVKSNGIRIELGNANSSDLFFLVHQIILPLVYYYNPQFVFYQLEGRSPKWIMRISHYIVGQLSCLANGHMIVNLAEDSEAAIATFRSIASHIRLHRTDSELHPKVKTPTVSPHVRTIVAKLWHQQKLGIWAVNSN